MNETKCAINPKSESLCEIIGAIETMASVIDGKADRLDGFVNGVGQCCAETAATPCGAYDRLRRILSNMESTEKRFNELLSKIGV